MFDGFPDTVPVHYKCQRGTGVYDVKFEGLIANLERRYRESSATFKAEYENYMRFAPCETCKGMRLKKTSLAVTVGGKNIYDLTNQPVGDVKKDLSQISFTPNEQTRRMLKRINDRRSYLDRKLREGNVIFFGARYPTVSVEPRLVRSLLAVLPEAMREANDGAQLFAMLRGRGVNYLNREICDELVENRQDYLQIIEHRKEMEKNDELQNLLGTGTRSSR